MGVHIYTPAEGQAREEIDRLLAEAGWVVQDWTAVNLYAGAGQAVREFPLKDGHGRVDYLLFVNQSPVGTIEAKPAGTTLTEVELQSLKYITGLPDDFYESFERLPFAYESTGKETRLTNGLDPDPRSRRVFAFHRPETLREWAIAASPNEAASPLERLQHMPPLVTDNLWNNQETAIRNLEDSLRTGYRRALIQMATGSGKSFTAANISYRLIKQGPRVLRRHHRRAHRHPLHAVEEAVAERFGGDGHGGTSRRWPDVSPVSTGRSPATIGSVWN